MLERFLTGADESLCVGNSIKSRIGIKSGTSRVVGRMMGTNGHGRFSETGIASSITDASLIGKKLLVISTKDGNKTFFEGDAFPLVERRFSIEVETCP